MSTANRARIRLLIGILVVTAALATLVWALNMRRRTDRLAAAPYTYPEPAPSISPTAAPTITIPSPLPTTQTGAEPSSSIPSSPQPSMTQAPSQADSAALLIPVAGVRPEQLRDTFTESRSAGRMHDAIDIAAPRGTPVLAATDGRIVKFFQSVAGGTTIYQLGTDERIVYYYAHLDHYADGLKEGDFVSRGTVIAYVGDTGNAGAGNYHLHFSISIISDPKRYWDGTNINPYPLLQGK